ncbi:ragulator complex protein LAMTOR3-A-like [Rhopilema esculentum]|uniref:ragulator complex protein LAMTOR3-A-like n=1 Tax=Rhopilema esculentum TaxID=499914 RepID=UPI0031CF7F8D
MTEALHSFFHEMLERADGLLAIMVTDREGVPVIKVNQSNCPELATRGSFLATFSTATEQASKLGLSKNKNMICLYQSYQIIMFNFSPLVVTVIAKGSANTGMILSLEDEFSEILKDLSKTVGST